MSSTAKKSKKVKPRATSLQKLVMLKDQIRVMQEEHDELLAKAVKKYGEGDFYFPCDEELKEAYIDHSHEVNYFKITLSDNLEAMKRGEPNYISIKPKEFSMSTRPMKNGPQDKTKLCS